MGEVTTNDAFGRAIRDTIIEHGYRKNLEIGSWDGTGSTQCFIEGMRSLGGDLILQCIEIEQARFDALKGNTAMYPWVQPFCMSTIPLSKMIPKSFAEVWESPHNNHTRGRCEYPRDLVNKWYNDDIPRLPLQENMAFLTSRFCLDSYDAVLIDGCEFTGYSEFALLKNKAKCFFLDDVFHAYKCAQIYDELVRNPDWALLCEGRDVRNGFAVFAKR